MRGNEQYRILPVSEAHICGLHAIWDTVAREKRFLALLEAPPEEDVRDFVRSNISCGNPHLVVLAETRVVGWCDIVRLARPTMSHRGALSVGLLPEWRGLGIGRQLLTQIIRLAWDRQFRRIDLVARADNTNAITLYKTFGFATEGLRHKAFFVDGQYFDLVDMALLHPELVESGPP